MKEIIKPTTSWLKTYRDADLVGNIRHVVKGMGDNVAIYDQPFPPLPVVQAALDDFVAASNAAKGGERVATAIKRERRLALTGLMRQLAAYVSVACQGSLANLIASGFPLHKLVRTSVGQLPTPATPTIAHGLNRSEIAVTLPPLYGARSYVWRITADTPGAVPRVEPCAPAYFTFTGLIAGVNYTVEVCAVGTAGPSSWSQPVSLIAD